MKIGSKGELKNNLVSASKIRKTITEQMFPLDHWIRVSNMSLALAVSV